MFKRLSIALFAFWVAYSIVEAKQYMAGPSGNGGGDTVNTDLPQDQGASETDQTNPPSQGTSATKSDQYKGSQNQDSSRQRRQYNGIIADINKREATLMSESEKMMMDNTTTTLIRAKRQCCCTCKCVCCCSRIMAAGAENLLKIFKRDANKTMPQMTTEDKMMIDHAMVNATEQATKHKQEAMKMATKVLQMMATTKES